MTLCRLRGSRRARVRREGIGHALSMLGLLAATAMPAQGEALAVRGSAIAAEKCSQCHSVGVADASPHKITPPFRTLGQDYPIPMLQEALKTGVVAGHEEMPQFDLGVDAVKALVAYIDSLNPGAAPHLARRP